MGRYERQPNTGEDVLQQSLARLERAVAGIQDSTTFRRYLEAQARFHEYSWGNVMLIMAQNPEASRVAGYRAWESMGRQVRKGEKAIRIIAPSFYKKKELDEHGDEQELERISFRAVPVFDISQTDGEPLPDIAVPVLDGNQGAALYGRMEALALTQGVTVHRGSERFTGQMMGFYLPTPKEIHVRKASQLQMTKTLAHELAHHFGGHEDSDPATETVAESVAFVVLAHHGLDSGERSFPYIATWAQDTTVLKAALGTIQALSATIIDHLETWESVEGSRSDSCGDGANAIFTG